MLSISEVILGYVSGFGILQGVLLSLLIYFHPKADKSVGKFLALFIFCFSLVMTLPFFVQAFSWKISYLWQPLPLLTGPLIYLYVRSFKEVISLKKALPHFLVFVVYYLPTYWNVMDIAAAYPTSKTIPEEAFYRPMTIVLNYLKMSQSVIYYFLAMKTLRSYQRTIKNLFSETTNIELRWGRFLLNGFVLIVFTSMIMFGLMIRFPQHFNLLMLLTMAIATPYVYIITYKGVMQPTIWQKGIEKHEIEEVIQEEEKLALQTAAPPQTRVVKTIATGVKIDETILKITSLMEQDKLYQETDLTLQTLADKLKIPSYQVSQAINDGMNKNFYDLINSYRVEEAKRLLLNPRNRNYTILSVGFEAGFNSKTTFNTVFKKFTGLTPTDFRVKEEMALA